MGKARTATTPSCISPAAVRSTKRPAALRLNSKSLMGTSKNADFAQMQGAEKISQRSIWMICKQEIFSATQQLGWNMDF
jgi:hypothetical protein